MCETCTSTRWMMVWEYSLFGSYCRVTTHCLVFYWFDGITVYLLMEWSYSRIVLIWCILLPRVKDRGCIVPIHCICSKWLDQTYWSYCTSGTHGDTYTWMFLQGYLLKDVLSACMDGSTANL